MYSEKDQILVDKFIKALVKEVVTKFPKDVDFVILFGSAARDEFVPGVSDIDLVFQLRESKSIKKVEKYSTKIFWKLNNKFKTGFEISCASKEGTLSGRILHAFEKSTNLYTPLFVFGPKDLDWKNGRVHKNSALIASNLVVSQATVFHKFKTEGKMYFGRDIRKSIHPRFSWWERFKGIMIPRHLAFFATLIVFFLPKEAVKYCNKAILYEIDSAVIYLNELRNHPREKKVKMLRNASRFDFNKQSAFKALRFTINSSVNLLDEKRFSIVDEALDYKINGFNGNYFQAVFYTYRSFWFIVALNWVVVLKKLRS